MSSPSWTATALLAIVVGGAETQGPPAAPTPARNVREVVSRAAGYVAAYGERLGLIVGVERYTQQLRGDAAEPETRRLVAEFALLRVAEGWAGFREVFEVDGVPVADRRDRLETLLLDRAREGVLEGRRIADESARYNLGPVQRNFNTPTMALFFLHPRNQERFRYTKSGEEVIDGLRVWAVSYKEANRPTIVRTPTGRSAPASGVFWIDPLTGRVVRTRIELEAEIEPAAGAGSDRTMAPVRTTVDVTVSYRQDERFGLLLPSEMRESYEVRPAGRHAGQSPATTITCVAAYSDFKTFETFGRLIVR
jgi:hypothetical protein